MNDHRSPEMGQSAPAPDSVRTTALDATPLAADHDTLIVGVPDTVGRLVGRRLPFRDLARCARDGVEVCSSILAWDIEQEPIDGLEVAGFHSGWHDLTIIPDPTTIRSLAWLDRTAFVFGDLHAHGGEMVSVAPRSVLRRQVERLRDAGWSAVVATELEFYLQADGEAPPVPGGRRHDYVIGPATNKLEPFFSEARRLLARSGIEVESSQAEWGAGQWEMNLACGEPLPVADAHVLFKLAMKDLALRHGLAANFMAKAHSGLVGSSCHIHLSLRTPSSTSAFYDADEPRHLSMTGRYAVGGVLRYAAEFMPFYAGTINSYKRLAASDFCGWGNSWGFDNRTATCRVVGRTPDSIRVEFRVPGADANPYLAVAAVLASVRRGIIEQIDPGPAVVGDARQGCFTPYPTTLEEATLAFASGATAREEFGTDVVAHYATHFTEECRRFHRAVTDWEIARYATAI